MSLRAIDFGDGLVVPVLGQGTWLMGEQPERRREETAAIRGGIERGLTLIDTAEMYGDGVTETFLGQALAGLRERITLVSKVYPHHAEGASLDRACEGSLRRLKTDRLDLYLLHWRGRIPLRATVEGMERLKDAGKIRAWGVSNFDRDDMVELDHLGADVRTNQVLYNLTRRGPEFDLMPWMRTKARPIMAYSPLEQGRLKGNTALSRVAERHRVSTLQIALAWVLAQPGLMTIVKAGTLDHVAENRAVADIALTSDDILDLDQGFPPPSYKIPLEML